nr:uncharacterized protein LOC117226842 [Megalopta genalis]
MYIISAQTNRGTTTPSCSQGQGQSILRHRTAAKIQSRATCSINPTRTRARNGSTRNSGACPFLATTYHELTDRRVRGFVVTLVERYGDVPFLRLHLRRGHPTMKPASNRWLQIERTDMTILRSDCVWWGPARASFWTFAGT